MKLGVMAIGTMLVGFIDCDACTVDPPQMSATAGDPPSAACKADFTQCDEGIYNFYCWNQGTTKNWWTTAAGPLEPRYVNACAQVDPTNSNWEDLAKAKCTVRCLNVAGNLAKVCDDANWSSVEVSPGPQTCTSEDQLHYLTIEDELGTLAANDAEELPCELWDSCLDFFSFPVRQALSVASSPGVRNTADTLLETVPLVSTVTVWGNAQAAPTVRTLTGEAAYTAQLCGVGEVACPFYLAQLDLQATSAFSATVAVPGAPSVTKTITGGALSLKQPTLGIWLPDFDYVIFAPGALVFNVSGTLSGTEIDGENGSYNEDYIVPGYVFGSLDTGLTISADGSAALGTFSVYGEFEPE